MTFRSGVWTYLLVSGVFYLGLSSVRSSAHNTLGFLLDLSDGREGMSFHGEMWASKLQANVFASGVSYLRSAASPSIGFH